jgi:hypothetical protein
MKIVRNIAKGQTKRNEINKWLFYIGVIIFRVSLDLVYTKIICSRFFAYEFSLNLSLDRIVYSYATVFLTSLLLCGCVSIKKPSSILIVFLYLFAYVPNMSLYCCMGLPHVYFIYSNIYWFFILSAYMIVNPRYKFKMKELTLTGKIATRSVFYIFFFVIVIYAVNYNGLSLTINLNDVYDLRMSSRVNAIGSIMEKILPWAGNVVFPIAIIDSIRKRKPIKTALFVFAEIVAFSINGTKTWLFVMVISVLVIIFVRKEKSFGYIPSVFAGLNLTGYLLNIYWEDYFISNFFIRRVFFSTSLSNWYYIDFFSKNSKLYMTHSALGWIQKFGMELPYGRNISSVIGELYFTSADINASSGTIADAYSNFGLIGLVIFPIFIVLVAKILDAVARDVNIIYIFSVIISTSIYLLNGNIFSGMVTYGYLFAVVLIYYMKRANTL